MHGILVFSISLCFWAQFLCFRNQNTYHSFISLITKCLLILLLISEFNILYSKWHFIWVLKKLCVWTQNKLKEEPEGITLDGSVDWHGRPAIRDKSGTWVAGIIILCKLSNTKPHFNCYIIAQPTVSILFYIFFILFLLLYSFNHLPRISSKELYIFMEDIILQLPEPAYLWELQVPIMVLNGRDCTCMS